VFFSILKKLKSDPGPSEVKENLALTSVEMRLLRKQMCLHSTVKNRS